MRKHLAHTLLLVVFIASVCKQFWSLAAFIFVITALRVFFYYRPNSKLEQFLRRCVGPMWEEKEMESRFLFRLALCGFVVFLISASLCTLGMYLVFKAAPQLEENMLVMAIISFALPLIAAMGLLGALLCLLKGSWLCVSGRDRYYLLKEPMQEEKEENNDYSAH